MTSFDLRSILFFLVMMFFSYVHECAHMAAAECAEKGSRDIRARGGRGCIMEGRGIFGNVMHMDHHLSVKKKMIIYMAGPGANIIIIFLAEVIRRGISYIDRISEIHQVPDSFYFFLEMVIMANIMLAAFNLLPFFPLDGGRATVLILGTLTGHSTALKIGILFSAIFAVCVFISGIYLVKYNLMNIILSADAIYFLYILKGEIYGPY